MAKWKTYALAVAVLVAFAFFTVVLSSVLNETASTAKNNEEIIKRFCEETNVRNHETKRRLNEIIDRLPEGPQKDRARASTPGTILLINALAPVRDCEKELAK